MSRVACYIDGFNMYHAISGLANPKLKWLSLMALARSFLEAADELVNVAYFTAFQPQYPEKYQRHFAYVEALEATGVEIVRSRFMRADKYCKTYDRYCPFDMEKQTDVALAVRVVSDVQTGLTDRVILMTADSDQVPLVEHILDTHPTVAVEVATPPGRETEARELCKAATKFRRISEGRLGTCLLPRNVTNSRGVTVAICPSAYLPD